MTRLGYYPGCSLGGTAKEYDVSTRAIASRLDVFLEEIQDWNCCGATSAHATNHLLSVALPARSLAIAESQGLQRILTPCAACFNRLAMAGKQVREDKDLAAEVCEIIERPLKHPPQILSMMEFLQESLPTLRSKITKPLQGMKIACYYGCLLLRPAEICTFDDPEAPSSMEEIVRATGAEPVDWPMRTECCGGGFSLSRTASVVRLGRTILESAQKAGAQALVLACPMCQSNLDFRQQAIAAAMKKPLSLPIIYITQLIGVALGLSGAELGFAKHYVSPAALFDRLPSGTSAAVKEAV